MSDSCDPMDCNLPGSSVYRIFQVGTLKWVAIYFSRGSSWSRNQTWVSCIADGFFTNWATREAQVFPPSFFWVPVFPNKHLTLRITELSWMIFKHHQSSATLTIRSAVYGFLFCCKRQEPPYKSNQEGLLNCLSIALISQYPSAGHQYNWAITSQLCCLCRCLVVFQKPEWLDLYQPTFVFHWGISPGHHGRNL